MKTISTLLFCFFLQNLFAQMREPNEKVSIQQFAATANVGLQINTYNEGLNNLNLLFKKNKIITILPIFYTAGVSFVVKHNDTKSRMSFFELSFSENRIYDRAITNNDLLVPDIIGFNFTGMTTKKIWRKKKMRLDGGFGIGLNKYNIRLIDRKNFQIPLDTFLKYPSQSSASLNFSQNRFNWNIVGRFGITYDAQWFKKVASAYEFSLFIDFTQSIYASKDWLVTGTNIPVANFPKINFSNARILFSNSIFFNYTDKKQPKKSN
jgi:hypothetical protein